MMNTIVIAYAELIHQAKTISIMNFNPIETHTIVAIIYFILTYPITLLVRRFENKAYE
jgi:ABC-type amino acid transport system permease subunit